MNEIEATAKEEIKEGTPVELNEDGTVSPASAKTPAEETPASEEAPEKKEEVADEPAKE